MSSNDAGADSGTCPGVSPRPVVRIIDGPGRDDDRDCEVRQEIERTALANAVAIRVIKYRVQHALSQSALARQLGMHQPAIARLEAADHEPTLSTLGKLAKGLGIEFHIDITGGQVVLRPEPGQDASGEQG